jgi:hypothetical protein
MSAPGFYDVRAIVFDRDDTLYPKRDCMLSGIDAKVCIGQAFRVLDLPACCRCRWVVGP